MPIHFVKNASVVVLSVATALACDRPPLVERVAPQEQAQAAPAKVQPYPRGRWRLADSNSLNDVVLWVSQIVIRHRDAKNTDPAFAIADWHSRSPGGERSRPEALALAQQLRERAASKAEPFATLATAHSEDIATQPFGGSLGGVQAFQLTLWPEVLDALSALRPGDVSQVVETRYGFHILERRPPPPEQTVTGAHIVIAHDDARWIKMLGRGNAPPRSRGEALALASQLYERAKQQPAMFSQLVEQYSEHGDALRGGDMGTWSTREPSPIPREVEALASLAIGEVAPPIDSPVGFQIIQRTPNREREQLALASIQLPFSEHDPRAKASAQSKAAELLQLLRKKPGRFGELSKEYNSEYVEEWQDGRGLPKLTTALLGVRVGEIAPEPVESIGAWVIAKRTEPTAPTPVITYELPSPQTPDITAFLRFRDETLMRSELQKLGDEALATLTLPEEKAGQLRRLHREDGRLTELGTSDLRENAFNLLLSDVKVVLDAASYDTYLTLVNQHFERLLFQGG